jgi:hypothetical protein
MIRRNQNNLKKRISISNENKRIRNVDENRTYSNISVLGPLRDASNDNQLRSNSINSTRRNKILAKDLNVILNSNSKDNLLSPDKSEERKNLKSPFKVHVQKFEEDEITVVKIQLTKSEDKLNNKETVKISELVQTELKSENKTENKNNPILNFEDVLNNAMCFSQLSSIPTISSHSSNSTLLKLTSELNSTKDNSESTNVTKDVEDIASNLSAVLYNNAQLPVGKENDENYKICMINNNYKKDIYPRFDSDFCKKRVYSQLIISDKIKIEPDTFIRKISSEKKIYTSFINFTDNNKKKHAFKIFREEDIGMNKKYSELLRINVSILINIYRNMMKMLTLIMKLCTLLNIK